MFYSNLFVLDESKPLIVDAKPGSACVVLHEEDNRSCGIVSKSFNLTIQLATVLFIDYTATPNEVP
jgi:hypothetical protein